MQINLTCQAITSRLIFQGFCPSSHNKYHPLLIFDIFPLKASKDLKQSSARRQPSKRGLTRCGFDLDFVICSLISFQTNNVGASPHCICNALLLWWQETRSRKRSPPISEVPASPIQTSRGPHSSPRTKRNGSRETGSAAKIISCTWPLRCLFKPSDISCFERPSRPRSPQVLCLWSQSTWPKEASSHLNFSNSAQR